MKSSLVSCYQVKFLHCIKSSTNITTHVYVLVISLGSNISVINILCLKKWRKLKYFLDSGSLFSVL